MLILGVTGGFQKFLKGGDVYVNIAIFHIECLDLIFCFDPFSNVCEGIFESFGEFFLEFFIFLGVSTGQLPIHGFLLFISPVFDFSSTDVAKA